MINTVSKLAPISKKFGAGSTGKSGAGSLGKSGAGGLGKSGGGSLGKSGTSGFGKSTGSKISSSKSSSSTPKLPSGLGSSSGGKLPGSSSSKNYNISPFSTPKDKSSKTGFGIIWLPTRKNKKKEVVYSAVNDKYPKAKYERSPSMYRITWRRLSGEQIETAVVSMSGDSPDFQPHKKKEEETELLMPDRTKVPIASIATAGTAVGASEVPSDSTAVGNADEKQEFIQRHDNKEDSKEAAGDTNKKDTKSEKSEDYLENDKIKNKPEKGEKDTEKFEDKVDSVYLRPPPPHKTRSAATVEEEEDCGIKCLYYTIQCCDCVLM
ncbi:hypothetical protein PYW07_000315 [Mythimna separata]|uniref:Uncharacterized protein n=1 Tax=Mythimna separata TaxID=271217 RepID=A0AAD7Z307_MYTSE|nr:hypothetical protein PYW07_000315 [Mythimna separata]